MTAGACSERLITRSADNEGRRKGETVARHSYVCPSPPKTEKTTTETKKQQRHTPEALHHVRLERFAGVSTAAYGGRPNYACIYPSMPSAINALRPARTYLAAHCDPTQPPTKEHTTQKAAPPFLGRGAAGRRELLDGSFAAGPNRRGWCGVAQPARRPTCAARRARDR